MTHLLLVLTSLAQQVPEPTAKPEPFCQGYRLQVQDYIDEKNLQAAERLLLSILPKSPSFPDGSCYAEVLSDMANVMLFSGRLADAEAYGRRAVAAFEGVYPKEPASFFNSLGTLAIAYFKQGKTGNARHVVMRMRSISPLRLQERALMHSLTAAVRSAEGKWKEAESESLTALKIYDELGQASTATSVAMLVGLAAVYLRQHRPADAEQTLHRGIAILERVDTEPIDWIRVLQTRAVLRRQQKRWTEAARDLQEALSLADQEKLAEPLTVQMLLDNYALVLRKMQRKREAREIESRASALRRDHPEWNVAVDVTTLLPAR
jgi:tetratricopeptide (TPR) repeat protein